MKLNDWINLIAFVSGILYLVIKRPRFWDEKDVNKASTGIYLGIFFMVLALILKKCNT